MPIPASAYPHSSHFDPANDQMTLSPTIPRTQGDTPCWTSNPRWIARIEALQVLRALNFFEWAGLPRAFFTTNKPA